MIKYIDCGEEVMVFLDKRFVGYIKKVFDKYKDHPHGWQYHIANNKGKGEVFDTLQEVKDSLEGK